MIAVWFQEFFSTLFNTVKRVIYMYMQVRMCNKMAHSLMLNVIIPTIQHMVLSVLVEVGTLWTFADLCITVQLINGSVTQRNSVQSWSPKSTLF